ncbi:hypothetical protein LINPERHAP1_LOCUS31937 [Linum perenne]
MEFTAIDLIWSHLGDMVRSAAEDVMKQICSYSYSHEEQTGCSYICSC